MGYDLTDDEVAEIQRRMERKSAIEDVIDAWTEAVGDMGKAHIREMWPVLAAALDRWGRPVAENQRRVEYAYRYRHNGEVFPSVVPLDRDGMLREVATWNSHAHDRLIELVQREVTDWEQSCDC